MPLIVTPKQLERRAELYHQLGSMTEAGIGLPQALAHLEHNPPAGNLREEIVSLQTRLKQGYTFSEALRMGSQWLPAFDVSLLEAGERSGRLDAVFKLLAQYYRDRARLIRSVINDLSYPVFILHVALLLFPVNLLVNAALSGGGLVFLLQKLSVFLPLYGGVFLLVHACHGQRGEKWRAQVEKILNFVPLLRAARYHLALARLAAALEALINAGVSIITSWELAATASGSPRLRRVVGEWTPRVTAGQTPAEAVFASRAFPEFFANLYNTGEISGKLDETLRRLHHHYQEEGSRQLQSFAKWSSQAVHIAILLAISWNIISFWSGYFGQINEAGGF